jgi:hypothetical protein
MVEYNNSSQIASPSYNAEIPASSVQYDAGSPFGQGYNPGMNASMNDNPFIQSSMNSSNQASFGGTISIGYGIPSQTNNQPDFSGPVSVEESQCPTGGKCVTCTYRCRMRKVA